MKLFGKLFADSVKDNVGNVSSTRIQSYHVLLMIYGFSLFMIASEIFFMLTTDNKEISSQLMIAFGGLLTRHLALLGINKNSKSEPSGPAMDYNSFDMTKSPEVKGTKKLLTEVDVIKPSEEDMI